jgi:hypothetical protein
MSFGNHKSSQHSSIMLKYPVKYEGEFVNGKEEGFGTYYFNANEKGNNNNNIYNMNVGMI